MADNVEADAGSGGATFASDDIGGIQFPRSKIIHGADGINDGDVSTANPFPVELTDNNQTVVADIGAIKTAVELIDDAVVAEGGALGKGILLQGDDGTDRTNVLVDTAGHLQIDVLTSALPSGAATSANQSTANTALAAIQTAVELIDNTVNGTELQVDVVAALPAGSNTIGDVTVSGDALTALQLIDNPIIVDDTAFTPASSSVMMAGFEFDDTTPDSVDEGDSGAARMSANRNIYTQIRDAAGNERGVNIDASNRLTVIADLGATDNTVLDNIDTNTSDIVNVIGTDGSAGPSKVISIGGTQASGEIEELRVDSDGHLQIDVVSAPSTAVTNAGTFVVQEDGAALTALQLIDDVVYADDADWTDGSSKHALVGGIYQSTPQSITDGDTGPIQVDANGNVIESNSAAILADTANMDTNLGTIAGAVAGSEMQVDIVAALPAGTNAIGKLAANSGVDIGDVDVTSISAGSNLIGDVGISGARTSGGTTLYKNIDVDESEDQVKGTAGQIYWIHVMNLASSKRYLKIYNATAATVVVGTTVPDLTFPLPTQGDSNGAGFTLSIPNGIAFGTAITIAATTGLADDDNGAPGANEVIVNLGYA